MEEDYTKILTKEKIDNILNMGIDDIKNLLHNASQHIKDTVATIVIAKLLSGEIIDLNKVRVISIETGKDIDEVLKASIPPKEEE
jgi:hypothetical protein